MMKNGLTEKIKSAGYWRVNIRPVKPVEEKFLLGQVADAVEKSCVSLRGWDYPHFSRNDEHGGHEFVGEYVENWCDWYNHIEFWRMYRSTQFLHYKALWEDLHHDDLDKQAHSVLSVLGAVYSITEIVEFTSRLFHQGLYQSGAKLSITLANTAGRRLWNNDGTRMPFFNPKITNANTISIARNILPKSLAESPIEISHGMILELFDNFGWNPDPSLIRRDQAKFYAKQL